MAKFMYKISYSGDGLAGTIKEGFAQREAYLKELAASMDCTFEGIYWALGDSDAYFIIDGPAENVIAGSLMASTSGMGSISTIPLMTAAEMDAAAAKMPSYRTPGS